MKKIFALCMALMMVLGLAACGNTDAGNTSEPDTSVTETPEVVEDAETAVDLAAFYEDIMAAAGTAPAMMEITDDLVDAIYPGLSDVELKQCVLYTPSIGAVAVEFAFVEVANEEDIDTVKEIFENRISTQIEQGAFYPSTVEGWQKHSSIVNIDNIVCLFVCEEKDGMIEALLHGTSVPAWAEAPADDIGVGDVVMPEENIDMELPVGGMDNNAGGNTDSDMLESGTGVASGSSSEQIDG